MLLTGPRLHALESGLRQGNVDLRGSINLGTSSCEGDLDKWKAAVYPRCLQVACVGGRTGIGLQKLDSWRDWLQELSEGRLLARGDRGRGTSVQSFI